MTPLKSVLFALALLGAAPQAMAQDIVNGRVPVYPVPYVLPGIDSIKGAMHRIRTYYEGTSPQKLLDGPNGKEITNFSKPNKDATVSPGFSSEWTYTHGVVLSAFAYLTEVTGDQRFFANNEKFFAFEEKSLPYLRRNVAQFGKAGNGGWSLLDIGALDDCGAIGASLIKTYLKDKNKSHLETIKVIDEYISHKQFRLPDGTLARHRPQLVSVWTDDMYMSVPFLTNMAVLTGEKKYYDDAVRQVLQMADRLYVPQTGLFDHGWNANSDEYDPRFYWGRENGWALMSMAELLPVLPKDHPGREKILHLYRSMVRSLANLQDGTGFWYNLLDHNNSYTETSATAIFTYAIAKGINEGWISHVYGPVAITGWNAVNSRILANGGGGRHLRRHHLRPRQHLLLLPGPEHAGHPRLRPGPLRRRRDDSPAPEPQIRDFAAPAQQHQQHVPLPAEKRVSGQITPSAGQSIIPFALPCIPCCRLIQRSA